MPKAITLSMNNKLRSICETKNRYEVLLFGKKVSEIYYNMTGYVADYGIPTPDGIGLEIGEKGISAFKKAISRNNIAFNDALLTGETKEVAARRLVVLERLFVHKFYTKHEIIESNTVWKHNAIDRTSDDDYFCSIFCRDGDQMTEEKVQVTFFAGTPIVAELEIDGKKIEQAEMFPFKVIV